jgi:hypothetical protein
MVAVQGYGDNKDAVPTRLRRIEGQVRGLKRMVESDAIAAGGPGAQDKVAEASAAITRLVKS